VAQPGSAAADPSALSIDAQPKGIVEEPVVRSTSHSSGGLSVRLPRPSLFGAVSAYLALWLALFPVFQSAHLAFADHDHRFCHEHLRMEDVARTPDAETRAELAAEITSLLAARPDARPADLLLNFSLGRDPVLLPARPAVARHADLALLSVPAQVQSFAAQAILQLAPKTSPPSAASC
jgi:hypothetical protein